MSKVIGILIFFFSIGQINAQTIDELVEKLSKESRISTAFGFTGGQTEQFKTFKKLVKIATVEELVEFSNHSNPVVACYAGWGLVDKNYNHLELILSNFLKRKERIEITKGCIGAYSTISESLYLEYFNKVSRFSEKTKTGSQLFKLDSLILFDKNVSENLLNHAFRNNVFEDKFLDRIKFIAFEQKKFVALKYIFNNHRNCCEERLITELIESLDDWFLNKNIYKETFNILLSFDNKEIRKSTFLKLVELYKYGVFPNSKEEYDSYFKNEKFINE